MPSTVLSSNIDGNPTLPQPTNDSGTTSFPSLPETRQDGNPMLFTTHFTPGYCDTIKQNSEATKPKPPTTFFLLPREIRQKILLPSYSHFLLLDPPTRRRMSPYLACYYQNRCKTEKWAIETWANEMYTVYSIIRDDMVYVYKQIVERADFDRFGRLSAVAISDQCRFREALAWMETVMGLWSRYRSEGPRSSNCRTRLNRLFRPSWLIFMTSCQRTALLLL